jgi:hypothetical protein
MDGLDGEDGMESENKQNKNTKNRDCSRSGKRTASSCSGLGLSARICMEPFDFRAGFLSFFLDSDRVGGSDNGRGVDNPECDVPQFSEYHRSNLVVGDNIGKSLFRFESCFASHRTDVGSKNVAKMGIVLSVLSATSVVALQKVRARRSRSIKICFFLFSPLPSIVNLHIPFHVNCRGFSRLDQLISFFVNRDFFHLVFHIGFVFHHLEPLSHGYTPVDGQSHNHQPEEKVKKKKKKKQ